MFQGRHRGYFQGVVPPISTLKYNNSLSYNHASSCVLGSLEPLASDIHDTKKHYDQVLTFGRKIRFCHTLAIQNCVYKLSAHENFIINYYDFMDLYKKYRYFHTCTNP